MSGCIEKGEDGVCYDTDESHKMMIAERNPYEKYTSPRSPAFGHYIYT